jgi:hypothetical protein
MTYFTGEGPQPGDIISRGNAGDRIRVHYIGVNGIGWAALDESEGASGLSPSQWSLVERDADWEKRERGSLQRKPREVTSDQVAQIMTDWGWSRNPHNMASVDEADESAARSMIGDVLHVLGLDGEYKA